MKYRNVKERQTRLRMRCGGADEEKGMTRGIKTDVNLRAEGG